MPGATHRSFVVEIWTESTPDTASCRSLTISKSANRRWINRGTKNGSIPAGPLDVPR